MAIVYNITKSLDKHILSVQQDTIYNLYYTSDDSNSLLITSTILNGNNIELPVTKDGKYKVVLSAESETDITVFFNVFKYLQNSITNDILSLLCGLEDCGCKELKSNCLGKAGKKCLTHKSIFVKLLTYQSLYLPIYGNTYYSAFVNFLEDGIKLYNCKTQAILNKIIQEECITGSVKSVDKLFSMYLALYWAGMYSIDKDIAGVDEAELTFIKEKYSYDKIVNCLCETCVTMEELEEIFTTIPSDIVPTFIAFQFDNISYNLSNIDLLTISYLNNNGTEYTIEEAETGMNYTYGIVARIGFVITGVESGTYEIRDALNNVITDAVFDIVYDNILKKETYISKEFVTPSSIYFKFIKLINF
jgi:hypothetical protein